MISGYRESVEDGLLRGVALLLGHLLALDPWYMFWYCCTFYLRHQTNFKW